MKKTLLLACLLAAGCTTARQTSRVTTTTTSTNGVTVVEERLVEARLATTGDGKQAVDSMKVTSSAKTAGIGVTGATQEQSMSDTLNAVSTLLERIFQAGVAAGKTSAIK